MAKGIHADYAKIGFTVVIGVVAVLATLVYLGGAGFGRHEIFAETYYSNPVSGLSVGSDVNFRGVKVGEVRKISFIGREYAEAAEEDLQKIYIRLAFDERTLSLGERRSPEGTLSALVAKGLRATVASSGITGLSHIELNFPKTEIAEKPISWRPADLCIPPAPSMLENASDAATRFLNRVNRMDFLGAWSNLTTVAASSARIAENLDALVESQRAAVADIVRNIDDAAASLRELSSTLRDNPSLLLRARDPEPLPETMRR